MELLDKQLIVIKKQVYYTEAGDFQKATDYFEEGLALAKGAKNPNIERFYITPYIKAAKHFKAHEKLSQLYENLIVINDSLFSQQN